MSSASLRRPFRQSCKHRRRGTRDHEPVVEDVEHRLDERLRLVEIILGEAEDRQERVSARAADGECLLAGGDHRRTHPGNSDRVEHRHPEQRRRARAPSSCSRASSTSPMRCRRIARRFPAFSSSSATRSPRSRSRRRRTRSARGGVWRCTTPGSVIVADTSITVPTVRSAPTAAATASVVSPFCTAATTAVAARATECDQLGRPARVVRLHHDEDDVERMPHLGDLAHVQSGCAHGARATVRLHDRQAVRRGSPPRGRATARRGSYSTPASSRSAPIDAPFAPAPRTATRKPVIYRSWSIRLHSAYGSEIHSRLIHMHLILRDFE